MLFITPIKGIATSRLSKLPSVSLKPRFANYVREDYSVTGVPGNTSRVGRNTDFQETSRFSDFTRSDLPLIGKPDVLLKQW